MDLSTRVRSVGGVAVVTLTGELDSYSSPRLAAEMEKLARAGQHHVVLDLSDLEFFDSAGLGVFVGARKEALAHDGSFAVVTAREQFLKIFSITGLDQVFVIRPSVEEAVAAASSGSGTRPAGA